MLKMLKHATREFCSSTGLHGYCFLVIPKRNLFERVIWIIILIISVIGAVITSVFAWTGTQGRLVQTVADSTHHRIWNYPFPAVTICNYNQISKTKAYEMAKYIKRPPDVTYEQLAQDLRYLMKLLPLDSAYVPHSNLTRLQIILDQNNIPARRMLQRIAPNCTDMFQRCKWKGEEKRCEVLFEQTETSLGFCCSFNYYAVKNHQFSGALPYKTPKKPRKVSGCGYKTGLEVLIDNTPNDYFATDVNSHGHRILLHSSYNFPDWSTPTTLLEMNTSAFLTISPVITECSSGAAKLSIQDRNCLFPTEKDLHSFQYYTYHNCVLECRINITNSLCGCIPFYLHNQNGSFAEMRICDLRDRECLNKNKHSIRSAIPGVVNKLQRGNDKFDKCKCLPDCELCNYPFESSAGIFSRKYATNGFSLL